MHDGDDEPVAYHRVTLTSSVSVRTICKAIKKYAFINSHYPVIISAETRCSPEQGTMLAVILREEFGSALVTEATNAGPTLPSPDELKYKILFKVSQLSWSLRSGFASLLMTVCRLNPRRSVN